MLRKKALLAALTLVLLPALAAAQVEKYKLDPVHSEVSFTVRHFVSKVSGKFNDFAGEIQLDPKTLDPTSMAFSGTVQTTSVDTNNEKRDNHLRSADFFDAATHPTITFKSKKVEKSGESYKLAGDLTIRGVTKPVVLDLALLGFQGDKAGFEATGKVNRQDFGVQWNRTLDQGGTVLGDDVAIVIRVEADRQKPDQAQR